MTPAEPETEDLISVLDRLTHEGWMLKATAADIAMVIFGDSITFADDVEEFVESGHLGEQDFDLGSPWCECRDAPSREWWSAYVEAIEAEFGPRMVR